MTGSFPTAAVLVYLAGVFASACAQIILKKEAMKPHESLVKEYLNFRVILGYGITFGCTLLTVVSYRLGMKVSWSNVLESMGYLFVTFMGISLLKERVSREKWIALAIILTGVMLFTLGGR